MRARFFIFVFLYLAMFSISALNRYVPGEYSTIQAALTASSSGDSVLVAPGIYNENINWPQVDGIVLQSTGNKLNTIINANHAGKGIGFVSSFQNPVVTIATKINGFTIRNGLSDFNGAGIICYYASPEFNGCIIAYNECTSINSGGGIYCYGASPHFNNVIIVHNKAYSGGGAHIDPLSSPVFNNCVIADNTLSSPGGSYAAGIYGRYEVYFQLNNCTVSRNQYYSAAAIHLGEVCIPSIQHTTITDNVYGLLIMHNGGLTMQNCNVTNNLYAGLWHNDTDADVINAQNNWWGSATGPFQEIVNPSGLGDQIMGVVTSSNWLLAPDTVSPPTPPTGLGAVDITNNSFTLNWVTNPEPGISNYIINYGTDSLAVIHPNNFSTAGTSYTIANLTPGTKYAIQVAAVNSNNVQSWYSTQLIVRTTGGTSNSDFVAGAPTFLHSYPNPFSGSTKIRYELKQAGTASMDIYNSKGELVKHLLSGQQASGSAEVNWNGKDNDNTSVSAGIYFVKLTQNGKTCSSKLILIK